MKKYFIADILTSMKVIPALMILGLIDKLWSGQVFILFAAGELLDALDGMAAKKWPHPPETEKLWFRRNLKLIESGLDLFLGVAALIYVAAWVNYPFGIWALVLSVLTGGVCELVLYGRFFGTPETAKKDSLFDTKPDEAERLVECRLAVYCALIFFVLIILIADSFWPFWVKISVTNLSVLVAIILLFIKDRDGRINLHKFF